MSVAITLTEPCFQGFLLFSFMCRIQGVTPLVPPALLPGPPASPCKFLEAKFLKRHAHCKPPFAKANFAEAKFAKANFDEAKDAMAKLEMVFLNLE